MAHRTIYRGDTRADGWVGIRATETENATGYFVQNAHGATVAGPFATIQEAWREQDRLDAPPDSSAMPDGLEARKRYWRQRS